MTTHTLRLALSSTQLNWGGGEQFLWSLGNALADKGHNVAWFAPQESELAEKIRSTDQSCYNFCSRKPSLKDLIAFRRTCQKLKIQVFHANDPHALTWGSIGLLGQRQIGRLAVKHTTFRVRRPLKYNLLSDIIACVSHAVQNQCIQDGVWERKTRVIYAGFQQTPIDRQQARASIRQELGVNQNTIVFSAVGNLYACKAYSKLIEASAYLRNLLPDFRIAICGQGPEHGQLQAIIDRLGVGEHVKLLGFREDAHRWIAGSDSFVHPSTSEGLSLVTIQAQLQGIPVVAAKSGGLAEVLTAPQSANELAGTDLGWIIRDWSPDSLAKLMVQSVVQSTSQTEMLRLARQLALERFGIAPMADAFERAYMRCAYKSKFASRNLFSPAPASL